MKSMLRYIDHTLLAATATWEDIKLLCNEAIEYRTASVCVPPCYVKRIKDAFGEKVNICTVIGFPLGYSTSETKKCETKIALEDGASEIDMVINITDVKNGDFESVEKEIREIKAITKNKILKVIIETAYLTEDEKIKMCALITNAGADYIKTSTGFAPSGAILSDILLFKKHIGENVKIKAAGGVKTIDDLNAFIDAGCSRIGTSSAIKIINGETTKGY